jgi:PAS domain S-box-containing protein
VIAGLDYRGIEVIAAYRPISGNDWHIVAKVDRAELLVSVWQTLQWIIGISIIALLAILLTVWRLLKYADELKTNQLLSEFFDLPFIGMAITCPQTQKWLRMNARLCEILGYSYAELQCVTWAEITYPEDLCRNEVLFEKLKQGEIDHYALNKRYIRKDGVVVDTKVDVRCHRRSNGSIEYLISTIEDITERKRTEQLLAQSVDMFRAITDNSPLAIAIYAGEDQNYYYVNPMLRKLFGYSDADLQKLADWWPLAYPDPDYRQQLNTEWNRRLAESIEKQLPFQPMESIVTCKDGSTKHILWGYAYTGEQHIAYGLDLTEIRLAENALLKSEKKFQIIAESAPMAIIVTDAAALDDQEVLYLNPKFTEIFGYTIADAPTVSAWWSLAYPDEKISLLTRQLWERAVEEAILNKTSVKPQEVIVTCKDGTQKNIEFRLASTGTVNVVIGTDFTERKRQELELVRHRDHLEELVLEKTLQYQQASKAKSEFLANMSHEIRTPMNGVIGMIDVLMQTALRPDQAKMAYIIRDSAYAQLTIINDILDFSKIEAGKMELYAEPFLLEALLVNSCVMLEQMAVTQNVSLELFVDPQIPVLLYGDGQRLRQILTNLVNNAIKFSSKLARQGEVKVRAECLRRETDQVWIRFMIKDNGIGINPAAQSRLFQEFAQADASTTRSYGGSGLGLVISQRLVDMLGGTISLQSTEGEGSMFTVNLPFAVLSEQPSAEEPANRVQIDSNLLTRSTYLPTAALPDVHVTAETQLSLNVNATFATSSLTREQALRQGRLILVAEDNEVNQSVIREQLKLLNCYAEICHDGSEALARWMAADYALVLTDIHMPNMDGYQLAGAIRQQEAQTGAGRTPIIALTAIALTGEAEKCATAGMDDYLTKPTPLTELKVMLEKWLPYQETNSFADREADYLEPNNPPVLEASEVIHSQQQDGHAWDGSVLATIIGNDPTMQRQVLAMFLVKSQEQQKTLQAALLAGDAAKIAATAHAFKSAARAVGALRVAEICQELEAAGKKAELVVCQNLWLDFTQACERAEQLIKANL